MFKFSLGIHSCSAPPDSLCSGGGRREKKQLILLTIIMRMITLFQNITLQNYQIMQYFSARSK